MKHTPEGAVEFVRFYIGQTNAAWTRPDPTLIEPLGSSSCDTCRNWLGTAEKLVQDRRRYAAHPVVIKSLKDAGQSPTGRHLVRGGLRQIEVEILDAQGHAVDSRIARDLDLFYALDWSDDRWYVAGVAFPQS